MKGLKQKIAATVLTTFLASGASIPAIASDLNEYTYTENGVEITRSFDCAIYEPNGEAVPYGFFDPYTIKSGLNHHRDPYDKIQYATGWVSIMNKENDWPYYHYTNVQLHDVEGEVLTESGRIYGYGYVSAQTGTITLGIDAYDYVYYGEISGPYDPDTV